MDNYITTRDQNNQYLKEDIGDKVVHISRQPKLNYLVILTIILLVIVVVGALYIVDLKKKLNIANLSQINNKETIQISSNKAPTNTATKLNLPVIKNTQTQIEWVRRQFATAWDVEFPKGWEINDSGLIEGNILIQGDFNGRTYQISMSYPIALEYNMVEDRLFADITLDRWVDYEMTFLPVNFKMNIIKEDAIIANTPSKIVWNLPEKIYDDGKIKNYSDRLTHSAYIWKQRDKGQRVVVIKLINGVFDSKEMEYFFRDFLTRIK